MQEATSKGIAVTEKRVKQYVRQANQRYLPTKVNPVIDYTDEPVIWCDIPVVDNTFPDGCK